MPISGPGVNFGWRGAWFGAWFGPPSAGPAPPPPPDGIGTLVTSGYGGGQIIIQGYGVDTGVVPPDGVGTIITAGYGGSQVIVQGYGSSAETATSEILVYGGVRWGGTVGSVVPVAETFLQALVTMLKASTRLTTAIGGPRIYSTWPGPKTRLPFIVIEDYIESQPGETIEHNLNSVVFSAYGPDKTTVKTVLTALRNSVDSPAQNKNSTRVPMQWSTGIEESSWRQPTLPPMRMKIQKSATDLWCWKIQYDFNILPNFQV